MLKRRKRQGDDALLRRRRTAFCSLGDPWPMLVGSLRLPEGLLSHERCAVCKGWTSVAELRRLVQGRADREIAAAFVLSRRTVTTQTSNLFAKLGAASRTEAVAHGAGDRLGWSARPTRSLAQRT